MKWEVRTMRSGTSCFDLTVFKKTVARFWPLWAAYSAMWLIFLPLQGLMLLRVQAGGTHAGDAAGYMENFASFTVVNWAEQGVYMALFFGVLAAMAVFSHLYSARSANLFGSLPVRREGLFLTHYLAGLSFMIVPNAAVFLLTLAVEAAGGFVSMTGLLSWLGVICGECLFFYSLAVFCGMFTGHLLALPAFYAIFNVLAYGVLELLSTVLRAFYYGFAGFSDWVYEAAAWLTPVLKLERVMWYEWERAVAADGAAITTMGRERVLSAEGLGTVGIYALAGLALAACAFLLYRKRRLESAGDVVSVKCMRPVFKYGVALCAGLALGIATAAVVYMREAGLIAAILAWGVIGYFAAQMLLDKSFRVFKKWKGAAAVAAVFAALFVVAGFDLTGYETRVPDPEAVRTVAVDGLNAIYMHDDADSIHITVDDPGRIELITALHRAAVGQRDEDSVQATNREEGAPAVTSVRLELRYTMKDGSTMGREYYVRLDAGELDQEGSAAWCAERLLQDRELYWEVYGFDELEAEIAKGGRLESAEFCQYDDTYGFESRVAGYGADARALLEAVKEDFLAGRTAVRTLTDGERVNHGWQRENLMRFRVADPVSAGTQYVLEIALQDTAASTIAELDRLGVDHGPGAVREWNLAQDENN